MDPQNLQLLFQKPSFSMHVGKKQQHFPEKKNKDQKMLFSTNTDLLSANVYCIM